MEVLVVTLILPILAAATDAPARPSGPVVVTARIWAPFISPMGEPFRPHGVNDDTLADWFNQADRNHDGVLTPDEMQADADRFFASLDSDHNGEIDPDELARYEWDVAPDVQVNSRTRRKPGQPAPSAPSGEVEQGRRRSVERQRASEEASLGLGGALQGAARYSLLNMPEPVAAADADFNRGITREEFGQAAASRFQLLDRRHQGRLTLAELEAMLPQLPTRGAKMKRANDGPDPRIGNPLPRGD